MKKILILIFLFLCIFHEFASPLFQVDFKKADSDWFTRFFEELDRHLENTLISGETYEIIEHILEEDIYHASPEISALKVYQTAMEIEKQLRKGIFINRIKMEARRRLQHYNENVELPLYLYEGSRTGNRGEFADKNPHKNSSVSGRTIRNGEEENGHKGSNGN